MDNDAALQIIAAHGFITQSYEYRMRKLMRWYSTTYHTPLNVVETIPIDDILINYYEVWCETHTEEQFKHNCILLTETEIERIERLRKEEEEERSNEIFLKEIEKNSAKLETKITDPNLIANNQTGMKIPEANLPDVKLEPIIKARIVDSDELEKLIEEADRQPIKLK